MTKGNAKYAEVMIRMDSGEARCVVSYKTIREYIPHLFGENMQSRIVDVYFDEIKNFRIWIDEDYAYTLDIEDGSELQSKLIGRIEKEMQYQCVDIDYQITNGVYCD